MKLLAFLFFLLLTFAKTNAQSNRWMYLSKSKDLTLLVDTLTSDTKQLSTYEGRNDIVLVWFKSIQTDKERRRTTTVIHIAIDTTVNQFEIISFTVYRGNNTVISSNNQPSLLWEDVVPESVGEGYLRYCKALNNRQLMADFLLNNMLYKLDASKNKVDESN